MAQASPVKERKVCQSASCKIDSIVRQLFLPMLSMPTPESTSFLVEDAEDTIVRQVAQESPSSLASEKDFVDYMVQLYRKFHLHADFAKPVALKGGLVQDLPV
jgi:hypothetical protein